MIDYPKANRFQFERLLERSAPTEIYPEARLIINILAQAWEDAQDKKSVGFLDAHEFFHDGRAEKWGGIIGIDGEFIKEVFDRHHPYRE